MTIARNKTTAIAVAMVLMLATSAAMISIPNTKALTTITFYTAFNYFIGQNSATAIEWIPTPNIFDTDPNYNSSATVWANAVVTFTRPDGTQDIINGPFTHRPPIVGGHDARIELIYTPNMIGTWTVTLYWPGDSTYAAVNKTDAFQVGAHFERRAAWVGLSMKPYPAVGLGQDVLINAWVTPAPINSFQNYKDYMFTFTRPDGTGFTVGPMDSEGPGTVWFNLPLDTLGNWTIKFEFPGDYGTMPSSVTRTITVQQDWIPAYPDTPLPTEPWNFPINVQNRAWRDIAGPWLQTYYNASEAVCNPYTEAPRTAHILWMLPAYSDIGGYVGSPYGINVYSTSTSVGAYGLSSGTISASTYSINTIMAGRGYSSSGGNITCFDIHTGQILWQIPGSFNVGSIRMGVPCLYYFGTRFIAYDAISGAVVLNVTGMPTGMTMRFYDEPYVYALQGTPTPSSGGVRIPPGYLIKWDTTGTSNNFTSRILWNVTNVLPSQDTTQSLLAGNLWTARHRGVPSPPYDLTGCSFIDYVTAVNLTTGAMEYNVTMFNPADPTAYLYRQGPGEASIDGVVYFAGYSTVNEGRGYWAYYVANGSLAWISEPGDYPWGGFYCYMPQPGGYGMAFAMGYNGVYALNATNGEIVWHYIDNATYGDEVPYASNIIGSDVYPNSLNLTAGDTYSSYVFGATGGIVGGGVVFAPNSEHSPTFYYRGEGMSAIDAFTGQKLWRILGLYTPTAIADGVLTATDSVNGFTYGFGKGDTSTTLATSSEVLAKGDSVLLKGTVLDMSSAQNGTACVSDADQEAWMEYLHMQQPYPATATGVSVSLDALDPNNNFVHIGDATTDLTGQYSFGWQPELEGKYTVVASFYSTEAYYGSTAETAILVTAAQATPTPTPTPAGQPDYTMPIVGIGIAIIIAMAVIGMLLLRKRP
jgi:outer membrane protein assembly factor BamB